MKFEVGKKYQVTLGSKHHHSKIIAIYKGEELNAGMPDCHTVEWWKQSSGIASHKRYS